MPELPEVEYTARQLRTSVVGATISEVLVFWERIIGHPELPDFLAHVAGREIVGVRRRGKFLLLDLSGELFLSIHRRMTGNFLLLPPGWEVDTHLREEDPVAWSTKGPIFVQVDSAVKRADQRQVALQVMECPLVAMESAYCRVCFTFSDSRRLLFTDLRKFGRIELWPHEQEAEAFSGLGPEPLSDDFSIERLATALSRHKTGIKQALLAQDVIAGIGNIYADEALFYAGIHPLRRSNSLTSSEIERLREGVIAVLTLGIEHGGTSFNDYRDLWGEAGDNYNHVRVYHKAGQPCVHCGALIERIVIAQRGSHFCPSCQKLTVE